MLTKIPDRVDDSILAIVWAVYDKLQQIDETPSSRLSFASSIMYNIQTSTDHAVFENELDQLRELLKIEKPKEAELVEDPTTRVIDENTNSSINMEDI
jgi:hypothetical protein